MTLVLRNGRHLKDLKLLLFRIETSLCVIAMLKAGHVSAQYVLFGSSYPPNSRFLKESRSRPAHVGIGVTVSLLFLDIFLNCLPN